jgi:hypothetical protein
LGGGGRILEFDEGKMEVSLLTFGVDAFWVPLLCQDPAVSEIRGSLAVVPLEVVKISVVGS